MSLFIIDPLQEKLQQLPACQSHLSDHFLKGPVRPSLA